MTKHSIFKGIVCVLFLLAATPAISGCAQHSQDPFQENFNDPLEPLNRYFFELTRFADFMFLEPLSRVYKGVVPTFVRNMLSNFSANINAPFTLVNDILQMEGERANITASRILINSTIGLGGLLDVATHMGYPRHREDFGQTLAVYGVPAGPYLFIPFRGPSSVRGLAGSTAEIVASTYIGPFALIEGLSTYSYIFTASDMLQARSSRTFTLLEGIQASSVDYYAALRNLYRQNRNSEILNGRLDINTLPDIEDMEDWDEEDMEDWDE